jgi:hypothetical protein
MALVVLLVVFLLFVLIVGGCAAAIWEKWREKRKMAGMTPIERQAYQQKRQERMNEMRARLQKSKQESTERQRERMVEQQWGNLNPAMICPHCQTKGTVRTQSEQRKAGVSGGKATAALLTGGTSLLLTGLSRKQLVTQAHCDTCNSGWSF